MWRNWIPHVNQENSDESNDSVVEDEENLNELVSPSRPHQSHTASPAALLVPDQPPTEEVLEAVGRSLRNLPNNPHRQALQARQAAEAAALVAPEVPEQPAIMPAVNFEDENGADIAGALREGIQAVAKVNWDDNDLKFVFKKLEISMAAAGAKKQYTKFQIVSTILSKHIEDEVKSLLEMQETEFENNDAYKQLKTEIMPHLSGSANRGKKICKGYQPPGAF